MRQLLRIAYDGTDFHGYARQSGGSEPRTVQGELERGLAQLYKQAVPTRAASRTDAGVHAEGQLVAFVPPFEIPSRGLLLGLAGALPADMVAIATWQEEGGPEAVRHENLGKSYRYRLRCHPARHPMGRRTEWHLARPLDVDAMHRAAQAVVGTHDFAAFRAADCQARTTTRTILEVCVTGRAAPWGPSSDSGRLTGSTSAADVVEVFVRGQAFLKNMVRILTGTLVEVGLGRRAPDLSEVLRQRDRRAAGPTAPPQGLTLVQVHWPQKS